MAGFFGMIFLVPLYLQTVRGFTPLQAGQATFTQAIGIVVSSQISGRLYATVGPRRLIFGGLLAASIANASYVMLDETSGLWPVRVLFLVRGLCMGFAFVPMQAATYATIAPADNGRASSIFATMRQVSISVSVAVLATVLAGFTPVGRPATNVARALRGFRVSYVVVAGMTFVAAILALRINDDDAAVSMKARSAPAS
jgi:MFS family permease